MRSLLLISVVAALVLVGAREAPAFQPNRIKLGPVLVSGKLGEKFFYDSNIFNRGDSLANVEDYIYNFSGQIALSVDRTRVPFRRLPVTDPRFLTSSFLVEQLLDIYEYRNGRGGIDLPASELPVINPFADSVRALHTERLSASLGYGIDTYNFGRKPEFNSIDHIAVADFAYRAPAGFGVRVFDKFLLGNSVTSFRNQSVSLDTPSFRGIGTGFFQNTLLVDADYEVLDDYFLRVDYVWLRVEYDSSLIPELPSDFFPGTTLPLIESQFDAKLLGFDVHDVTFSVVATPFAHTVITGAVILGFIQGRINGERIDIAGGQVATIEIPNDPRDARTIETQLIFQRSFSPKTRLSASVGFQRRDFTYNRIDVVTILNQPPPQPPQRIVSSVRNRDRIAPIGSVELLWRMDPFTTFILGYRRGLATSSTLDSLVTINPAYFNVQQRFGRKILATAGTILDFQQIDTGFVNQDHTDRFFKAFVNLRYDLQTWLSFLASYEFVDNKSEVRSNDYSLHRANAGVEFRF